MNGKISINLGLENIEVKEINIDKKGHYHIDIYSTSKKGICRECGNEINKFHEHDREIVIRHLPILGKECYLHIRLPRFQCIDCHKNPTTTQQLSWRNYNSSETKEYENHILKMLINNTVSDVSRKENISEGKISRTLKSYYSDNINWDEIEILGQIGIDEIALKKGHKNFVTIITSRVDDNVRVLAVLEDRTKATVLEFFKSIPEDLQKSIISVCSDFYDGFINAAKEVFGKDIRIVIDRFHIAKLYRKCVDSVRKSEMKRLKEIVSKEEYSELKGLMWAIRKSKLSDKEKEILKKAFKLSSKLKEAYNLSAELTKIFDTKTSRNGAIRKLKQWIKKVQNGTLTIFDTFINTLKKRMKEIANYFVKRENSGFVEGLNNRIKVLKRRCYGIVDKTHLFLRISLDLDKGYFSPIMIER